jgi:hypothetical protein
LEGHFSLRHFGKALELRQLVLNQLIYLEVLGFLGGPFSLQLQGNAEE